MSFAPFLTGWQMALTNRKMMAFYMNKIWPSEEMNNAFPEREGLLANDYARDHPTRLACVLSQRCELCFEGPCTQLREPWGVWAHRDCVRGAVMEVNSNFARKFPDWRDFMVTDDFYLDMSAWSLSDDSRADPEHVPVVWRKQCLAFLDHATADGAYLDMFGHTVPWTECFTARIDLLHEEWDDYDPF